MVQISEAPSSSTQSTDYLKEISRGMLKTQLFIGNFHEKRHVNSLNAYRDVILIDGEEKQFINNLFIVMKKIKEFYKHDNNKWIGFTDPSIIGAPSGNNLWVTLPPQIAFGQYWFKVKTVQFFENEVTLKLDIVRQVKSENSLSDTLESLDAETLTNIDPNVIFKQILNYFKNNLTIFYQQQVNYHNIKQTVIFLFMLISSIVVGGISLIRYLLDFALQLIRELSNFIHASTPIIITSINVGGRLIYGIFGFIFMMFHRKQIPQYPQVYNLYNVNPNMLPRPRRRLALPSARITPLD